MEFILKGVYGTKAYRIELLKDTKVENGYFIQPVVFKGRFKWGQNNLDLEISKGTKNINKDKKHFHQVTKRQNTTRKCHGI